MVRATLEPTITSFVFTPFYSFSPEFSGNWSSLIVAILPRILIGVVAGLAFRGMMRLGQNEGASLLIAGLAGSMTNTIGVMGLIYALFGEQYAMATKQAASALLGAILFIVGTNGVVEAIIAALLTVAVCKALFAAFGRQAVRA